VEGLMLDIVDTALLGSTVTSVEWETDRGRGREPVARGGRVGPLRGDALEGVRYLRITATSAESDIGSFALRDVWMPGVRASQPLMTPMPPPSRGEATALQLVARESARPACVLVDAEVRCDPRASRPDGDGGRLDRLVTLRESLAGDLAMRGVVRPGKQAAELFEPLGLGVRATASSWLAQDPLVRPGAVLDGDPATAWVADLGDLSPALTLEWEVPRVLDGLRIRARDGGQAFAEPLSVRIRAGGTTIEADLGPDGSVSLPDVVATSLEIEITRWTPQTSVGLINDTSTPMPVHVGEVDVPALADLVYRPGALTRTGTLCGFGPDLSINGTVIETRVEATLQDILRGDEVSIVPCGSPRVSLPPGTHRITVEGTELVDPLSITIAPDGPVRAGDASGMLSADDRRSLDVREWGPTRRAAQLGPGPESIVRVAESANAGWQATLDGAPLAATRIDGWQQGWVVPEGRGGELVLAYAPQGQQVAGLVAGVVAIALAFIAGLIPVRFPRAYAPRALPSMRPVVGVGVVTAAAGVLAGIAGLVCALLAILLHRWRYVPVVAFAAVSIAGACWVLRWPAGAPDILAVFGVALASLTAITRPGGAGAGADTTSGPRRTDPPSDG
jgi:arabinofuranan 3-O-arabinosyltransferase